MKSQLLVRHTTASDAMMLALFMVLMNACTVLYVQCCTCACLSYRCACTETPCCFLSSQKL